MKKMLVLAALAALLSISAFGAKAFAQGQPVGSVPAASSNRIALLDVSAIFKDHVRFKGWMEDMKKDVEEAEKRVMAKRTEITRMIEDLRQYNKGTPNYKSLDERITREQATMAVQVKRQKSDFLQREAKIYYNVYQEIWQATNYICRQRGYDMVLRFSGEQVNPQEPQSVLTGINRPVVWYNPSLDITTLVLGELNRSAVSPAAADRRGTAAPRQSVPFNSNPTR